MTTSGILLIVSLVLFVLGAFPYPAVATRVNVVSLGLAFFVGSIIAGGTVLH